MNIQRISRIFLALAVTCAPAALTAQDPATLPGSPPQPRTSMPSAGASSHESTPQDSNATPGLTGQEMKDKMFLRKAAQGGLAEVKMGQLAAEKGSSEEVKSFGSRMVADHTTLNNQMKPIADSMGVRLPTSPDRMDQTEYEKLSSLSGDEFDREYISNMVKDHRKDLREFHMEATTTQDPTLKAAVEKGEVVIREHAQMINKIAKEKGIVVPGSGRPAAMPQ